MKGKEVSKEFLAFLDLPVFLVGMVPMACEDKTEILDFAVWLDPEEIEEFLA